MVGRSITKINNSFRNFSLEEFREVKISYNYAYSLYNNTVHPFYLPILLVVVGGSEFLANSTVLSLLLGIAVDKFSPIISIESLNSISLLLYIINKGFNYT